MANHLLILLTEISKGGVHRFRKLRRCEYDCHFISVQCPRCNI